MFKLTTCDVTQPLESVHDVAQEVELSQQHGAVGASIREQRPALPVRSTQPVVTDVTDVHQEVQDVSESASWRDRGQRSHLNVTPGHFLVIFAKNR